MKNFILSFSILSTVLFSSCTGIFEPDSSGIDFPRNGLLGDPNVLSGEFLELDSERWYSMAVDVNQDKTVKIVMRNTSEHQIDPSNSGPGANEKHALWVYNVTSKTGWTISNYDYETGTQILACDGIVYSELQIRFDKYKTEKGTATIDIYYNNNDEKPAKSIDISW